MSKVEFKACEQLDFSDNYSGKKEIIKQWNGDLKVCWNSPVLDTSYPNLVQFCKLRGRLNNPNNCLYEVNRECSDYKDKLYIVEVVEQFCL